MQQQGMCYYMGWAAVVTWYPAHPNSFWNFVSTGNERYDLVGQCDRKHKVNFYAQTYTHHTHHTHILSSKHLKVCKQFYHVWGCKYYEWYIKWKIWIKHLHIKIYNLKQGKSDLMAATGLVILLKLDSNRRFSASVTLKYDGWPRKTIGHLFYAILSFLHYLVAIGEFKLELVWKGPIWVQFDYF